MTTSQILLYVLAGFSGGLFVGGAIVIWATSCTPTTKEKTNG